MSNRNISRDIKAAGAWGWRAYHLHVPIVMKSGSLSLLDPSRPVQGMLYLYVHTSCYICRHIHRYCACTGWCKSPCVRVGRRIWVRVQVGWKYSTYGYSKCWSVAHGQVTRFACATWSVLCMVIPHFQHCAKPFWHRWHRDVLLTLYNMIMQCNQSMLRL